VHDAREARVVGVGITAKSRLPGLTVGVCVTLGAGVGAALFAATSSPAWIAVGVAIGAAIGTAADQLDGPDSPGDPDA